MPDETDKPKIQAKDNPWYLLATLYGQPTTEDDALQARNRAAWNHYMGRALNENTRAFLAEKGPPEKGLPAAEAMMPFTDEEMPALEAAFAERHRELSSTTKATIPDPKLAHIDFANVAFDDAFWLQGFVFPVRCDFSGAIFSEWAAFLGAIFINDADFRRATFKLASFSGATFFCDANLWGAIFSEWADFDRATFSGGAYFARAIFSDCHFWGSTFYRDADFDRATFSKEASFLGAIFSRDANFPSASFEWANFDKATFSGWAHFNNAIFKNDADFDRATFSGAGFSSATFSANARFDNATFSVWVGFSSATFSKQASFINTKMEGRTSFEAAKFVSEPPQFFGAKLHEATVWRGVYWPPPPTNPDQAGRFVDAYERLKLEMDRLKKHEEELDFFARELQCRRILHGDWKRVSELKLFGRIIPMPVLKIPETKIASRRRAIFGRTPTLSSITTPAATIALYRPAPGLSIALYGSLCDYGRSYDRPLLALIITAIVGVPIFWANFGLSGFGHALGLSLANTFGVLGFRKDLIEPHLIESLPGWLKVVAAVQTVFGIVLLFLFGLAIRNRLRMK